MNFILNNEMFVAIFNDEFNEHNNVHDDIHDMCYFLNSKFLTSNEFRYESKKRLKNELFESFHSIH